MAKDSTKDMTVGSPMKLILGFSIPLLFGALFQQFYSVVDTVIVGRFLGVNALAGVGATGSLNFMIMGFAWECAAVLQFRWLTSSGQRIIPACVRWWRTACGCRRPFLLL